MVKRGYEGMVVTFVMLVVAFTVIAILKVLIG
jgi:hypothetical protein